MSSQGFKTRVFWSRSDSQNSGERSSTSPISSHEDQDRPICYHYQRGTCRFGDTCFKIHIDPVVKPISKNPKSKVSIKSEERKSPVQKKVEKPDPVNTYRLKSKVVCQHFLKGKCIYGEKCFKVHISPNGDSSANKPEIAPEPTRPSLTKDQIDSILFSTKIKTPEPEELSVSENGFDEVQQEEEEEEEKEPIDYVRDIDEERKLTKKERKRQERMLQNLVKKQTRKQESDTKLKSKLTEAFKLIRENPSQSLTLFEEILAMPSNQTQERRLEALLGRGRCLKAKKKLPAALKDVKSAIEDLKPSFKFVSVTFDDFYVELAEILILSGRAKSARTALSNVTSPMLDIEDRINYLEKCFSDAEACMELAYKAEDSSVEKIEYHWHQSLDLIRLAGDLAPECVLVCLLKAECLVHLNRGHEVERILEEIQKIELEEMETAICKSIRSLRAYFDFDWSHYPSSFNTQDVGFNQICQTFNTLSKLQTRWKSFHSKLLSIQTLARKANQNASSNPFLVTLYSNALTLDLTNRCLTSRVHFLLAKAKTGFRKGPSFLSKKSEEKKSVFEHLDISLKLNNKSHETLYERARLFAVTGNYEKSLEDLKQAQSLAPWNYKIKSLIKKVNQVQQKRKRMTEERHYDVLGVARSASTEEIRQAFKLKAKEFHPDKHPGVSDTQKNQLENQMKQINRAYKVLSETCSRRIYDAGHDENLDVGDFFDSDGSSDDESDSDAYESYDEDEEEEFDLFDLLRMFGAFNRFRM